MVEVVAGQFLCLYCAVIFNVVGDIELPACTCIFYSSQELTLGQKKKWFGWRNIEKKLG